MEIAVLFWLLQLLPVCPAEGWVTSGYGYREDPIHHRRKFHRGIDIANQAGTPLYAPVSGKVLRVGRSRYSGLFVVLRAQGHQFTYLHLQAASVSKGDQVFKGDQIGLMGSSGRATGPHLHLELRFQGNTVDPWPVLLRCPQLP